MEPRYYVYALIDPRDGKPFYIGKGQRKRMYAHVKEAAHGLKNHKCHRIRQIQQAGMEVGHEIYARFNVEADAYAYEILKIQEIGLGSLTNVSAGGPYNPFWWMGLDPDKFWNPDTLKRFAGELAFACRLINDRTTWCEGKYDFTDALPKFVGRAIEQMGLEAVNKALKRFHVTVSVA